MPSPQSDFRPVVIVQPVRQANTVASGVIDRANWGYPDYMSFVTWAGEVVAGATSGMVLRIFHSNTVSATASGMTAITSGNTSGLSYSNSGGTITLHWDSRAASRFVGAKLSVPTATADTGVLACCFGHQETPGDVTGVTDAAGTEAQARFIGQ
jgi:hypothetical protein